MRKPLEFLACVPVPWLLFRIVEPHGNYLGALIVAAAIPLIRAVAYRTQHERIDTLPKTVLIGVALCGVVGAAVIALGLWTIWAAAWSTAMGAVFLASLLVGRPVLLGILPEAGAPSSGKPAVVLTATWGVAFLFEGWWQVWSRADWPFQHFLAAVPAVSYLIMLGLVAWSFWYTRQVEHLPAS